MLDFPANKWPQTNRGRLYLRMGSCKPGPQHIWRKKSATAICGYWLWLWKCSDAFGLALVNLSLGFCGSALEARVLWLGLCGLALEARVLWLGVCGLALEARVLVARLLGSL